MILTNQSFAGKILSLCWLKMPIKSYFVNYLTGVRTMLAVLRQRNFGLLWIGQIISMIGDWVLFVALPFYIYVLTGSTLATGIMFIVQTLPRLFFGSVAGVFVDHWNRKYTMVIVNLIQALILVPLFLARSQDLI